MITSTIGSSRTGLRFWHYLAWSCCVVVMVSAFYALHDPLASMTIYASGLMSLNQIAAPLLILGLPHSSRAGLCRSLFGRWLFDPWVAFSTFIVFTTLVSLPGIFNKSLVEAIFAGPLGVLELLTGVMIWIQLLPAKGMDAPWQRGVAGWIAGLPMMVIGVIWIWSSQVLYSPYLNVICLWNVTPLQDQRWAGMLMILFGLPLQLRSAWIISELFLENRNE